MKTTIKMIKTGMQILALSALSSAALAEKYPDVKSTMVADGIYMLSAKGGNIGVLIGADGTFIVDDQFSDGTQAILKTIKALGGDTPRFLINTHFHGDHTGGNENIGNMGTVIYSHDNVRKRLSSDNFIKEFVMHMPAYSGNALPMVTFSHDISFHINGDEVNAFHVANAHTDGDAVIHFKTANVVHMGDTMFNGFFPFIDPSHGGSLKGVIDAVEQVLAMTNAETKYIPGHGPLAARSDVENYLSMLKTAYERLSKLKKQGKSVEAAIAAQPLDDLNETWGKVIFDASKWIGIVYQTI